MSILFTEGEVAVPSSLTVTTDRPALTFSRAVTKLNNATERVSRLLSLRRRSPEPSRRRYARKKEWFDDSRTCHVFLPSLVFQCRLPRFNDESNSRGRIVRLAYNLLR
ncbi:hypothetical protein QLX08_009447 [Tetragonisca angustula]|uniref:Uncharacterized protein n=1 Tax=Tetragonisca angustula TaxID=166442 RepID=A0AAW0ZGS9_9HYME